MRIAINCRSILLSQRTGIGRYTYHLLDSLGTIDQVNEYILHTPKGLFDLKRKLPDFSGFKNLKRYPDYLNQGVPVRRYDLYHYPCPDHVEHPMGKLVFTVHDLIYKVCPQAHTPQTIETTEKHMRLIASKADKIICVSESTRSDLHRSFDIPMQKTEVVYNGVDHGVFYPLSGQEHLEAKLELKRLGIDRPYVLYVGTIEPRKNLKGLLESFAVLKDRKVFQGQMVIVGMKGWMMENIGEHIQQLGIQQDLVFTDFINDALLRKLYNLAEVFVFPSLYEGFGFPILEAFCCQAAVITSSTSSCVEVAGGAALTVDPKSTSDLAQAMEQVLTDEAMKRSLQLAGLKRAQDFSFEKTARETLRVYEHV